MNKTAQDILNLKCSDFPEHYAAGAVLARAVGNRTSSNSSNQVLRTRGQIIPDCESTSGRGRQAFRQEKLVGELAASASRHFCVAKINPFEPFEVREGGDIQTRFSPTNTRGRARQAGQCQRHPIPQDVAARRAVGDGVGEQQDDERHGRQDRLSPPRQPAHLGGGGRPNGKNRDQTNSSTSKLGMRI